VVLEKETDVATHQTGRNSGVVHSGIYYAPGSYKARLCLAGRHQLEALVQAEGLPYERCGKVIIAVTEAERVRLQAIQARGLAHGLTDVELLDAAGIRQHEPHATGVAGLWVPYTGIVSYGAVCRWLLHAIEARGGQVRRATAVLGIRSTATHVILRLTGGDTLTAGRLVSCGGLQSDRLARLEGLPIDTRIVGFRGDYYELRPEARHKVRGLIYPVPDPDFPFLGVHLTRMTDGSVECGPNAVFSFRREGYSRTAFSLADTADALGYGGTWRFFARHWRQGWAEYRRAFSRRLFLQALQRLVPSLTLADLTPARSGVRAQALDAQGHLVDDFRFARGLRSVHVLNAPSPAATASLAIADEIIQQLEG
jgi:L-2-hydroxyglutarate oxidase LhgO